METRHLPISLALGLGLTLTLALLWALAGRGVPVVAAPPAALASKATAICNAIDGVTLTGPTFGIPGTFYTFTATVHPTTATLPITYTWEATEKTPVIHTTGLSDTMAFAWGPGFKTVTVTAANQFGTATSVQAIDIAFAVFQQTISPTLKGTPCTSVYAIANQGGITATTMHEFSGEDGPPVHSFSDEIGVGASQVYNLADIPQLPEGYSGHVVVSADQPFTYTLHICCTALEGVGITGPTIGYTDTLHTFSAVASPTDATPPIAYTWSPAPDSGQGTDSVIYQWDALGVYTITLVAEICGRTVSDTHAITAISARTTITVSPSQAGTLVHTDTQWLTTTIQVPVGAVTGPTTLVYTVVPSPTQPISPGMRFAGHAFDLDAYQDDQHRPGFALEEGKVVTLTLRYSDDDVAGIDESTLALYRWTGSEWEEIGARQWETYTLDIENNLLTARLRGLSRFSKMGAGTRWIFLPMVLKGGG